MTADHLPGEDLAQRPDFPGKDLRGLLLDAEHAEAFAARCQGADQGGLIEKEGVARRVGVAEQALDVTLQLRDLSLLATFGSKAVRRSVGDPSGHSPCAVTPRSPAKARTASGPMMSRTTSPSPWTRTRFWKPGGQQRLDSLPLAEDIVQGRSAEFTHGGPAAPPLRRGGRARNARRLTVLDHEPARGDQRRDLRITELVQKAPDVAINGLGPDALP